MDAEIELLGYAPPDRQGFVSRGDDPGAMLAFGAAPAIMVFSASILGGMLLGLLLIIQ
ncbi:MAG TPA: hypothetical protein VNT79_12665 [Phycisphaerae bacterium]|nr:hypothetical protein [Phycisphaerae bacterium]